MNEILSALPPGAMVLDLGCGGGSFEAAASLNVVRLDLEPARVPNFVQADAAVLPFRARSFDLVVANNSLEHVGDLAGCLKEIGRVLKPDGALYIAVPDGGTITDRLYRWLARGGGHLHQFYSAEPLEAEIERATGLTHAATRTLCTSLSFLNRKNRRAPAPRRLLLFGGGTQISLLILTYVFRRLDRLFGTRLSVYGWALYFGNIQAAIDRTTWTNVCVLCGRGHPSEWLVREGRVARKWGILPAYRCPHCGTTNLFTKDPTADSV